MAKKIIFLGIFAVCLCGITSAGINSGRIRPIDRPGSIYTWGLDTWGQVSNKPSGSDFIAVSGGEYHSIALRANGKIEVWGRDEYGQISQAPTEADFVNIAAGFGHNVAIRRDGSLVSWGMNESGQLGNGTRATSYQPLPVRNP